MEDVRQAVGRPSFRSYISNSFKKKQAKPWLDATEAGASLFVERAEEAPNNLNVSYLHRAPSQLASNQHWYTDDLSQVKDMTVRLLYLEPGQSEDPITGRLVCHPIQQKPRYDALSYSWGEQDDWTEITLNGMPGFAVTRTLWHALRRLRSTAVARPIWIDAICINQNNTAERSQQVNIMDTTFGNARSVLIWLGDCSDGELADCDQRSLVNEILSKLERDTDDATTAWWNRLWVVQARAFVQSHGFARKDEVSLEELLALTGNCYASDPLDYVFGIIGLVPEQSLDNQSVARNNLLRQHRLSPDYSLTPYELLTRLNNYLESVGDSFGGTTMVHKMLSWTASVGHLQLAKLLLESEQVDLGTEGPLALCYAAERGQTLMLKMLLDDFHLNANSRDHAGRSPLSWAAAQAQPEAVKFLIDEYHVDPSAKDEMGRTPLSWAAANKSQTVLGINTILDTVRIFLHRSEVDPDSEDTKGRTPLAWAVYAGSEQMVRLLLDTGRTDASRRVDGHTLVAWAFEFKQSSIAWLLIERVVSGGKIKNQQDWDDFAESGRAARFDLAFWSDGSGEVGEGSGRRAKDTLQRFLEPFRTRSAT